MTEMSGTTRATADEGETKNKYCQAGSVPTNKGAIMSPVYRNIGRLHRKCMKVQMFTILAVASTFVTKRQYHIDQCSFSSVCEFEPLPTDSFDRQYGVTHSINKQCYDCKLTLMKHSVKHNS